MSPRSDIPLEPPESGASPGPGTSSGSAAVPGGGKASTGFDVRLQEDPDAFKEYEGAVRSESSWQGEVERTPSAEGLVIVQTAFGGDVILTGGLVRSIREGWPRLRLAMAVRPDAEPLARMMDPDLEVLVFDKRGSGGGMDQPTLTRKLREGPWEAALLPHRSTRSAWVARRAGLRPRIGFGLTPASVLHTHAVPYRRGPHEIERGFDLLKALARIWDADPPPFRLPLFQLTPGGVGEAETVFAALGDADAPPHFAVLAPGSVWATKRWPEGYWTRLARMLADGGLEVVLIGGDEDAERCHRIAAKAGTGKVAAGTLSWEGTAAVLNRGVVLVSGDSAPVHLAGAVRCPVVALFGPTVPDFGFAPTGRGSRWVGMPLGCRPCTLHGSGACPEGHFRCMVDMRPEQVADAVADVIESVHGSPQTPGEAAHV